MKIIFILINIILLKQVISLKTSELCKKPNETLKCIGDFSHKCGPYYCTADQDACNEFIDLNSYLKLVKGISIQKRIHNLIKAIKICPIKTISKYSDRVCLSSFECYAKKGFVHLAAKANIDFKRRVYCPCQAIHKYKCGNMYCAESKHSCDEFKSRLFDIQRNNSVILAVDQCGKFIILIYFYFN